MNLDIENALIWAFGPEQASIGDLEYAGRGYPQDSTIRVEKVAMMGGWVDGNTAPPVSSTSWDAETIAAAVRDLGPMAATVVHYAKAKSRPPCLEGARHRWEPLRWAYDPEAQCDMGGAEAVPPEHRRGWKATEKVNGKTRRREIPRWVKIHEVDAPRHVARVRERYMEWWRALDELRDTLKPRLTGFTLADHMPPSF